MNTKLLAVLIGTGILISGFAGNTPVELPLTEVMLFSSGVGAFTHQGRINGDTSVRFRMSKDQLNDLLKSLYVTSAGEGVGIRSVTCPTELPLQTVLSDYRIDLTKIQTLSDILRQLKGVDFEVTVAGISNPVKGKLITIETRSQQVRDGNFIRFEQIEYAVLLTEKGLQRFRVSELTSVIPADKSLLAEMTKALTVLAEQRDKSMRTIDVNLSAKKETEVRMAYVIEAPVWKASYRLELDEKNKANLQAWAMVENPTRTEWKNVNLSLISGRPESFVQDLYTSIYLERPTVYREDYASFGPVRHDIADGIWQSAPNGAAPLKEAATADGYMGVRKMKARNLSAAPSFKRVGGDISATTGAIGELYSYKIAKPVTLGSRQSAMLELLSTRIAAEKVSFYSMRTMGKRPLNAVLLKNGSGLLLPQGPVTIFDGKSYGGDASLSDLASGQEQILSYGMDLEVVAIPYHPSYMAGKITQLTVDRGMLKYSTSRTAAYKCVFENKSKKNKIILFEIPRNGNAKIVNGMKPFAETVSSYRFLIPLKAGKKITAEVKMETPVTQSYTVNADSNFSAYLFSSNAEMSSDSKALAEKLIAKSRQIKNVQQELRDIEGKIRDLEQKHSRARSTLNTSHVSNELRTRVNKRLAETDEQLDKMQQLKDAKKAELQKLRKDFGEFLSKAK